MSPPGTVVLRRTWPQRLVILCSLAVIAGALVSAWFINDVYASISEFGRVDISGEVLLTDTAPGAPVNFLLIGEDSAVGLDPDDPATFGREVDPSNRFQADSITILRVDPTSGQAWVVSIPRDLLIDDRGTQRRINSLLLVEGPQRLIEAVTANFGITINHYMSLDFLGFREVVDSLDGVPVWFENPSRDLGSGLNIQTTGCHVLDGVQSLQYVRARHYEELVDGAWTSVGNADFGRIERQQDFLVLALDRAINRGARNPATLASLIKAGASSIELDSELTVAELVDVGEAFSDFNPENLERYGLEVTTVGSGAGYKGELLVPDVNEPIFDLFRGSSDLPPVDEVSFDLYTSSDDAAQQAARELEAVGFTVASTSVVEPADPENVIVHPPGELATAETLARWIEPIPRLVEDPEALSVSLVLGTDHQQILFLFPHEIAKMRQDVAGHVDGGVPDLGGARPAATTTSNAPTSRPSSTSTTTTTSPATTTPSEPDAPPTTDGIIGQAPDGQSCG